MGRGSIAQMNPKQSNWGKVNHVINKVNFGHFKVKIMIIKSNMVNMQDLIKKFSLIHQKLRFVQSYPIWELGLVEGF